MVPGHLHSKQVNFCYTDVSVICMFVIQISTVLSGTLIFILPTWLCSSAISFRESLCDGFWVKCIVRLFFLSKYLQSPSKKQKKGCWPLATRSFQAGLVSVWRISRLRYQNGVRKLSSPFGCSSNERSSEKKEILHANPWISVHTTSWRRRSFLKN